MTTTLAVDEQWIPEVDTATRLRLVRREYGRMLGTPISQGEMADLIGVPKNRFQQWEAGRSQPRDFVTVAKRISDVTRVDVAWLLGLDPGPTGGSSLATQQWTGPSANTWRPALLRRGARKDFSFTLRLGERPIDFNPHGGATVSSQVAA
jgi:hypothetical protein